MAAPPVDLVVPVLNEQRELPLFLEALAAQEGLDGRPLPERTLRVIVVDGPSSDGTEAAFHAAARRLPQLELVYLREEQGNHVDARRAGAELALRDPGSRPSEILASADVDTRFHPRWAADAGARLAAGGGLDAVTYAGHYPAAFWARVPRLAARYAEEVGTLFFPPATIAAHGLDERRALFGHDLFAAITRVPSDCGWAYRKDAYAAAGGYLRERRADGSEVMFEGRNLRFRLDRLGARIAYVDGVEFETSPRRLLHEAEKLLAGTSYADGFQAIRDEGGDEQIAALEALAGTLSFADLRRYIAKHYVLLPLVSRPALLAAAGPYLGTAAPAVAAAVEAAQPGLAGAAQVHAVADELVELHLDAILAAAERRRSAPGAG